MSTASSALKYKKILQPTISYDDQRWEYEVTDLPAGVNDDVPTESTDYIILKLISFGDDGITLSFSSQKLNRILTLNHPSKFCAMSFGQFKLIHDGSRKTGEYIERFLLAGIRLNNTLYKCFGWSNSQLKSRSCLLYAFKPGEHPMQKLNALGSFEDIVQVGKKAKRIGLLFSEAELGLRLPQHQCRDIQDIERNGHVFSDGCGLMSPNFAKRIARSKNITFHGLRYTPSVVQIRYRGYKGVLMQNPQPRMDGEVHFRKSMCKFTGCPDNTLSVLEYSKPYAFGKLNGELVTLLSALGIKNEIFISKQRQYFDMIVEASSDPIKAFEFLSYMGEQNSANRIVLDGLQSVKTDLKHAQRTAWAKMFDKKDSERVHIMIPKSRLLFGICDPTEQLREHQCHVRITLPGDAARSLDGQWVVVARNPCLHPGDIRKLRVKYLKGFEKLVDCIVFPTEGRVPQPSMMSGGDLDGDKFFVCWDSDLIPTTLHEPHPYPPAKEKPKHNISHDDLIHYFAHWSNASMGRVSNLYREWVRGSTAGATSKQCLQLNHLYSLCVDGERINIPTELQSPPKRNPESEPFIVELLSEQVSKQQKKISFGLEDGIDVLDADVVELLAGADDICLSEFELFQLVNSWASHHSEVGLSQFINHFDFGAFTSDQKAWIRTSSLLRSEHPDVDIEKLLNNAILQSAILSPVELHPYSLDSPRLHWRRLYSSAVDGDRMFFGNLTTSLEDFTRKLLIFEMGGEVPFKVALLISTRIKPIEEREDTVVDTSVTAFSFRPGKLTSGRRIRTTKGYRLGWNGMVFQLFNTVRGATFVWLRKSGTKGQGPLGLVSIALDRFGQDVARNIGRIYRTPIQTAEIYVISNRDRVGHEILDMSFGDIATEDVIPRIMNVPREHVLESIERVDWSVYSHNVQSIVARDRWELLSEVSIEELEQVGQVCSWAQNFDHLVMLVRCYLQKPPAFDLLPRLTSLLASAPRLCVLMADLGLEDNYSSGWSRLILEPAFVKAYLTALIQSSNYAPGLVLSLLRTTLATAATLSVDDCLVLIATIPLTVRSSLLAVELITLLQNHVTNADRFITQDHETRSEVEHLISLARNVCIDRCAEAEEICKCDGWGITIQEESECMVDSIETEKDTTVTASPRLDLKQAFRVGDHVRLRSASAPKDAPLRKPRVLDGLIIQARLGSLKIKLMEPPPAERCSWYILHAGNNTTASAMMDAIRRIAKKKHESCALYGTLISGIESEASSLEVDMGVNVTMDSSLNSSQRKAVEMATQKNLTLIWGPPGTGKTTTIVHIIEQWRRISAHMDEPGEHILVAASTNNAVDNVLAKYISEPGISHEGIIRVCPDSSSVSKAVIRFWVGAFVDGDFNRPSAAMREAQKKVLQAKIVFTTCTGAALGLLRKMSFTRIIIDEASQITEPNCLITLVKGCQKLVLVGDHVQLRPTVTPLGRAYGYDISLFERLYTRPTGNEVGKVMLDTQYRMHPRMAAFPSARFYDGKLLSGTMAEARKPKDTSFNWQGEFIRFIEAPGLPEGQESFYHGSKSNKCQAEICRTIVSRLQQPQPVSRHSNTMPGITTDQQQPDDSFKMSLTVLTPYTAQLKLLQNLERRGAQSSTISSVTVATVDSFQGREADIVVFCTVRCNANHSIGFLADERRMNVALTRARRGLIVVGHRESLVQSEEGGPFWRSWFESLGRRAVSRE